MKNVITYKEFKAEVANRAGVKKSVIEKIIKEGYLFTDAAEIRFSANPRNSIGLTYGDPEDFAREIIEEKIEAEVSFVKKLLAESAI